jgi:anti-anti-sigma factor
LEDAPRYYERDGVRILAARAEYDIGNVEILEASLMDALGINDEPLFLDFSETTYLDSTVLSLLVRTRQLVGTRLTIVVPPRTKVRRLFEITGLVKGLEIKDAL